MLTSKDVTRQDFTPTSMRRGYDEREVDDFLDRVIDTLRYYEQGGRPGPQAPEAPGRPDASKHGQRASRSLRGDPEQ
jgi:DivIVA domain-containing protein